MYFVVLYLKQVLLLISSFSFRYLALEKCVGTLNHLVTGKIDTLHTTLDWRKFLKQVTEGLQHLHSLDIVHGDLKPSNILISVSNGSAIPKLTDFGFSHIKKDFNGNSLGFQPAYTDMWGAPDTYLDLPYDIYSLALLFGFSLSKGLFPIVRSWDTFVDFVTQQKAENPLAFSMVDLMKFRWIW